MKRYFSILSVALLITGTTVGAGMLGLPLVTARAGFFPGLLITFVAWGYMLLTGLFFLEATLWMGDGSNILSIAERFMGRFSKSVTGLFFVFLYYCLMIAYFAAGAPLLGAFLSPLFPFLQINIKISLVVFTLLFGFIVWMGPKVIDRSNMLLSFIMMGFWMALVGFGSSEVQMEYLSHANWSSFAFALPVLFSAFGYHNIIPSLCSYVKKDKHILKWGIIWGTTLPFCIYSVWQWLIIGAMPKSVIEYALAEGKPVIFILQGLIGKPYLMKIGMAFAFCAVVTSVLGVAFSLVDFLGDGLGIQKRTGSRRLWLCLLTFLPPLFFAMYNPNIFNTALGIAGGFGESVLNGILPTVVVYIGRYRMQLDEKLYFFGKKNLLILCLLISLGVIVLEAYHLR